MKKSVVILLALALVIPLISAVEINIKSSYAQGETLIAKISGSFIDTIKEDNIFFYEDYVRVPIEYDILKLEDEYYIYALLPQAEKNYTLSIEDVTYYQGIKIVEDDIKVNFSTISELADFSINPGVISASESFSIMVQNLQDSRKTITLDYNGGKTDFSLRSGEKKTINFNIENVYEDNLKKMIFSTDKTSYEIPVYLFTNAQQPEVGKKGLKFEIVNPEITMSTNSEKNKIIYIKNTGEEDLKNILIYITPELGPYINLSTEKILELKKNSSEKIEFLINSKDKQDYIGGEVKAEIEGEIYATGFLYLNFISDYIPIENENDGGEIIIPKTCEELGGVICDDEKKEICEGEEVDSFEGDCCLSKICKKKPGSNTNMIIGWGIVIVIVLFLAWFFFKKYLGARGPLTILDRARGR